MGKTIGQAIDKKVKEYQKLYYSFKNDKDFKDSAVKLARHDLIVNKYIAERTLEDFDKWLQEQGEVV